MKILHIASIKNDPFSGVCVAVPQHIINQGRYAECALLNINKDEVIPGIPKQSSLRSADWQVDVLPEFRNPDLVVIHEVYHMEFVIIARALRKAGIPYIIIPHGCLVKEAQRKKWWKKLPANILFFNSFINNCMAIQFLSPNEKKRTFVNVKSFIGTNGISMPGIQTKFFNINSINLSYIGRLEIYPKGLDLLIQAVVRMAEIMRRFGAHMSIYGPDVCGSAEQINQMINKHNIKDIVSLHGGVIAEEKKNALQNTDVFVQTSRHEGMPMGILEAMSYGIPCLITDGTSLGDITRKYDAGWVANTTVESIAEALYEVCTNHQCLNAKSNKAVMLVRENYSWDVIAKDIIDVYKRLLEEQHI